MEAEWIEKMLGPDGEELMNCVLSNVESWEGVSET